MRVGLIGHGYWGKTIYPKLKKLSDVKFICTSKDTYVDKLNEVDWVVVCTPNQTHYDIVKKCLWFGKNVFCEKPLTPTEKQSKELYDLAKLRNVNLYVSDVFNYREEYEDLLKYYLTNPTYIRASWKTYGRSEYRNYIPASIPNLCYHDLYLLHPYIKRKKLNNIEVVDKNDKLNFIVTFDSVKVNFLYDRKEKNDKVHSIDTIPFTDRTNDALYSMLESMFKDTCDYKYNKEQTLFVNKMIDTFNNKLFQEIK
jgi:hypothetical protein